MADHTVFPESPAFPPDTGPADSLDDELRGYKPLLGKDLLLPEPTNPTGRGPVPPVAVRANKLLAFDPDTGAATATKWTHQDLITTLRALDVLFSQQP